MILWRNKKCVITNWNHKFQRKKPLVVMIEEGFENFSVLVSSRLEKVETISVDVGSITEVVFSLKLVENEVLWISVVVNVVVRFSMSKVSRTVDVKSCVDEVVSVKRIDGISRIHNHSIYV